MQSIIGHIILNVRNYQESESFYDSLLNFLGFRSEHMDEGVQYKMKSYRQGAHNLWIRYDDRQKSEEFVRDVGLDHLAFAVEHRADVDRAYELVKELNVPISRSPKRYPDYTETYYAFYFRDPNGIPLEIYVP